MMREWTGKVKKDSERVAANYAVEREKAGARAIEKEQEVKERDRIEAEYSRQLADLNHCPRDVVNAPAATNE